MKTLILTNEPFKFKTKDDTMINSQRRYQDSKNTIIQCRILGLLCGVGRPDKVVLWEPKDLQDIDKRRYIDWLRRMVIPCSARDGVFVYVADGKVIFTGNCKEFYEFIKEELWKP